jgi:hypothetical protein
MNKLYIIAHSERECFSIASNHGIPSDKIVPIYTFDDLHKINKNVVAICTNRVDEKSVEISHEAHQNEFYTIIDENIATEFISRFKEVINKAINKANTQSISINNARNIIYAELKVFDPKNYLDISIGKLNNRIVIYSVNSWTAGLMTLVNAH